MEDEEKLAIDLAEDLEGLTGGDLGSMSCIADYLIREGWRKDSQEPRLSKTQLEIHKLINESVS
jgi:hypothetical protein